MPFVSLNNSPLAPDLSPVNIYYEEAGSGPALVFLHGGWGYDFFPFDKQIQAFSRDYRILTPRRSGYGKSPRITSLPVDFHSRAASEMISLLDALKIDRAFLWGQSDGAVIAVLMGLAQPDRFAGIILEAFHYYRAKPGSREFFETMIFQPEKLGERVRKVLSQEHGADYWRTLLAIGGKSWLEIADSARDPLEDLYDGKLSELLPPTILIHGSEDPRTEPDELDRVRRALPGAAIKLVEAGRHSPHSESAVAEKVNELARSFLLERKRPAC